ncbi:LysM peptidoglycan-binding domain-containing protein [Bowmanella yangjiangensis]|uniref:LysM peptidoglycan-binding domain-containing protein n=1 Tax=Bowmanella yangjiangensis TaxID=2811230 RepID=A0ABS3CXL6_9ALTE|nr:LysM domain-containing protein [Bowmanella yangjiangensis]MBN7821856.1 LysM peptidoglycan-binding domain-containing protein [Bowmanella yangjiangensis]
MSRWFVWLCLFPAWCMAITVKPDAPEIYVVKKGDTLWDISSLYLDQPWQWPELWRHNSQIKNPHLIYPGDELRLEWGADGQPTLVMNRTEEPKTTIKLSPSGKRIDKSATAIPVLPWTVVQPFIENGLVMSEEEYQALPKLLGDYDGSIRYASGDMVVGEFGDTGQDMLLLRQQGTIRDMHDNVIGVQVRHVADASLLPTEQERLMLVNLHDANFEAVQGDRIGARSLLQQGQDLELQAVGDVRGHIIGNLREHNMMGKLDIVVLDLGEQDGILAGSVMGIYLPGPKLDTSDTPDYAESDTWLFGLAENENVVTAPPLKVGELVVFRVFENTSYGLIVKASNIIKRGALVAHP